MGTRLDVLFGDLQALLANVNTPKNKKFSTQDFLREWKGFKKAKTTDDIAANMVSQARSYGATSVDALIASGSKPPI